jgi:hypothetical protein
MDRMMKPIAFMLMVVLSATFPVLAAQEGSAGLTGRWITGNWAPSRQGVKVEAADSGPAMMLDFSQQGNTLTGQFTDADTILNIEEARITGARFEFVVYRRIQSVMIGTIFKGELVNSQTLSILRLNPAGRAVDLNADGTQRPLTFRRVVLQTRPPADDADTQR